jgi:hypothetical protein
MGARTVTTREFICNHCNEGDVFDNDGRAGMAGWALLTVNGKEFALCPEHYTELKSFLNVDGFGPPLGSVGSVDTTQPEPEPPPDLLPPGITIAPPTRKGLFR